MENVICSYSQYQNYLNSLELKEIEDMSLEEYLDQEKLYDIRHLEFEDDE